MSLTLANGRLKSIRMSGLAISSTVGDNLLEASMSLSTSKISELTFSVLDDAAGSLTGRLVGTGKASVSVTADGSKFRMYSFDSAPGPAGSVVSIVAQSTLVQGLREQVGEKNWGEKVDGYSWVKSMAKSVKLKSYVQPMGKAEIKREKPKTGSKPQSTWDVMMSLASDKGMWIFQRGSSLVIGRPQWLAASNYGQSTWRIGYKSWGSHAPSLLEAPAYAGDPESDDGNTVALKLLAGDAARIRPGDHLYITDGKVSSKQLWLVTDVDIPGGILAPVSVTAVKPYKTYATPPKAKTAKKKTGKKDRTATATGGSYGARQDSGDSTGGEGGSGPKLTSAKAAQLKAWGMKFVGQHIDYDGGFGPQCVDGFKKYHAEWIGGPMIRGHGKHIVANCVASGMYTRVSKPQAGDVVSWGPPYGNIGGVNYGHVAIVLADMGKWLYVINQRSGTWRVENFSKNGVVGYARPKRFKR